VFYHRQTTAFYNISEPPVSLSNTGELPRNSFKPKPPNFKDDSRGATFYRIKKTNMDKLRKEKRNKKYEDAVNLEKGIEETISVTAKQIGKPSQMVQKNFDIHIGNVNTYNIYLNGEQKQTIIQSQTPKMSRGVSPPENIVQPSTDSKRHRKPLRNVPTGTNINGKQNGKKSIPSSLPSMHSDTKSSFKIATVRRNNLIQKEESIEENSIPTLLQKPAAAKYKPYHYDGKRPKKLADIDLAGNIRQPSPLDTKIRGVDARFKKI
jgi:hypothetical protein